MLAQERLTLTKIEEPTTVTVASLERHYQAVLVLDGQQQQQQQQQRQDDY